MLPRKCLTIAYLLLALCPALVTPQLYLRYAVCMVTAGVFVYQGCSESVNIVCRLIAFQLKFINCRLYPCVYYGSAEQNQCVNFPGGCPLEYVKVFGLCSPFEMCCGTGGTRAFKKGRGRQILKRLGSRLKRVEGRRLGKRALPQSHPTMTAGNEADQTSDFDMSKLPPELHLPQEAGAYISHWPKNETDPAVVETAIKVQYDRFLNEIAAINVQGAASGMESLRIVSYEDYRAVGLGEKEIDEVI